MTKQEWVLETIAEGIVDAINRFKKERPYALHELASDSAVRIREALDSLGLVIRVDRELFEPFTSCVCDVCNFIKEHGVIPEHSLAKAGLATESLICPCKKEPCECPSINRGSFAKYVEEEV